MHSVQLVSDGVSFAVGVGSSIAATYTWEKMKRHSEHRKSQRERQHVHELYDPRQDGLYRVHGWSDDNKLLPSKIHVSLEEREAGQSWIDPLALKKAIEVAAARGNAGRCGYVSRLHPDWRESPETDNLEIGVSECDYSEGVGADLALRSDPAARQRIADALDRDPLGFIRTAPPCPLSINVAVLSADGQRFLALRRSGTVQSARNLWTVGIYETMTWKDERSPGEEPENFFELAKRGLREELGLVASEDYSAINVSWFGYRAADVHQCVYAQVRASVSDGTVLEKRMRSHSADEAAEAEWLPLTWESVMQLAKGQRLERGVGTGIEESDALISVEQGPLRGEWIIHAAHSLTQLWAARPTLR